MIRPLKSILCTIAAATGVAAAQASTIANFVYVKTAAGVYSRITEVQYLSGECALQANTYCGYIVGAADATQSQITTNTLQSLIDNDKVEFDGPESVWVP
jgi:hypothetical protein